ncbi:hypothetical protein [Secundilactobacillus collinoides]|uniref:Uncharacterized protein n=2 Tax=Secundilactobacillus collinoides TaxID=33960 RepID=A0A0R2BDZ2_SECCO|nr:hypothetical protein [Secundilactobacillus collinoides]KRM77512.1 hypothetical protein FC82_GL002867 [Secundilactobacillus collinoides DSM 20515 = JCM 1123]KZL43208.1 hypothetical protein TY91_00965 [Secundilactobacillus collinoides]
MEHITLPLVLDKAIKQRYADGTSLSYVVTRNPFETTQYGVHLDLMDKRGKIYHKTEVYFDPGELISQPFEVNGGAFELELKPDD